MTDVKSIVNHTLDKVLERCERQLKASQTHGYTTAYRIATEDIIKKVRSLKKGNLE